jgi:mRNA interferase HigB
MQDKINPKVDIKVLNTRTCKGKTIGMPMRLIKQANVIRDASSYPTDIQKSVFAWCKVVKQAHWTSLADIRKTYDCSVDQVDRFLIFNIKDYRLIVTFNFKAQIIYYKYFLTHKEYDKGHWKDEK